MAKYPYIVNKNGIWYPAGEEVPEKTSPKNENLEQRQEKQPQYTKTDINRMSTAELQSLAAEVGIEDAFETSGGELKKLLIEHFEL